MHCEHDSSKRSIKNSDIKWIPIYYDCIPIYSCLIILAQIQTLDGFRHNIHTYHFLCWKMFANIGIYWIVEWIYIFAIFYKYGVLSGT